MAGFGASLPDVPYIFHEVREILEIGPELINGGGSFLHIDALDDLLGHMIRSFEKSAES